MGFASSIRAAFAQFINLARMLLVICVFLGGLVSSNAWAQQGQPADGVIGWTSAPGPAGAWGTANEACEAQWKKFMDNGYSRYLGATPDPNDWTTASCDWTRYQYLCPQETGAGFGCGTILPNGVRFSCATGYTPTVDGHCRQNPAVERKCNCPDAGTANPTTPNPIVLSTGAKVLEAEDYASADSQFRIGRKYRSFQVGRPIDGKILPRSLPRGLIGGWNFEFGQEIQLGTFSGSPATPNAKVAVLAPDGTGVGFVLQASGTWIPDPSIGAANTPKDLKLEFVGTLPANLADVQASASTWKLTDGNDTVWTIQTKVGPNGSVYNTGWPTQKVERGGYSQTFAYASDSSLSSITDAFGRTANFTWAKYYLTTLATPPAGAIPYPLAVSSIALPDGTTLRYTYDPPPATSAPSRSMIKNLIKVEHLTAGNTVLDSSTYLYEDARFPTHITGEIDNSGNRVRTVSYDPQGRATSSQLAGGAELHSVAFGTSGTTQTRAVTNPLGKVETYSFSAFNTSTADYRLTQVAGAASTSTAASTDSVAYGSDTFVASSTDAESRIATATRDARGRPLTIVEGSGAAQRTTTITWNSTFNVPATIVRAGLIETYQYDSSGRLTSATSTDTTSQTVPYSTNGQSRTYGYIWNSAGRLLSVNGPRPLDGQGRDDITSFTYDAQGNVLTQTNPLGQAVSFGTYDANGRPGTMTDANGVVTLFTYDGMGRALTITNQAPGNPSLNAVTTIAYDSIGQVTSLTSPATEALLFDYDNAGRVIAIKAANGERRDFSYDLAGNVTSRTVRRSDGSQASRIDTALDDLNRIVSVTSGVGHTGKLGYDRTDNLVSSTTPNKTTTTQSFDALGRLSQVAAPDGGNSTLGYDPNDNVTTSTDPILVTTQFTYNGFGEVIREVSPDRGTNTYWYNEAGQRVQSSDGRGQVIAYTRDYLGRVTAMVPQGRPASEAVTYTWDSGGLPGSYQIGRLGRIDDGSGTTQFQYDHRGSLLAKQQSIGASTSAQLGYTYDAAGRITQIAYPSDRLVRYSYDGKGRVSQVDTKASASVTPWTLVAGSIGYEPFAAMKSMALGNGLTATNDWGNEGRLASRRLYRTADNTSLSYLAYRYDGNDNITAIVDQLGPGGTLVYGYDKLDRLNFTLINSGSAAGTASYSYTPATNRLASVTDASGARTIAYDARGNTASEIRPGGITATTAYDGYGRLAGYSRNDAGSYAFAYNGLDDRVTMDLPTGTRRFVYDAGGRVMGEYGLSAADVKAEFIWLSPEVGAGGAFGGDDGLGGYMPLAVATPDSGGTVQLDWVHGGHLGVPLITTDAAGNPITGAPDYLAPGFPGQSRVIADLYYNRYRDYDPSTGRYIQADPIGLYGGSNPYGYVGGNPVNMIDPMGLGPTGATVGGAVGGVAGRAAGATAGGAIAGPPGAWIGGALGGAAGRAGGRVAGSWIEDICKEAVAGGRPPPRSNCRQLNEEVQRAKQVVGALGRCRAGMGRWDLIRRKNAWLDLARARAKRDVICWNGGDLGHQQAQADAWKAVSACGAMLQ